MTPYCVGWDGKPCSLTLTWTIARQAEIWGFYCLLLRCLDPTGADCKWFAPINVLLFHLHCLCVALLLAAFHNGSQSLVPFKSQSDWTCIPRWQSLFQPPSIQLHLLIIGNCNRMHASFYLFHLYSFVVALQVMQSFHSWFLLSSFSITNCCVPLQCFLSSTPESFPYFCAVVVL